MKKGNDIKKAPGKSHRKGLALLQVADKFRNNETARQWIEEWVWPDGPFCPDCGSFNVQSGIKHKTMTHRCRDCPKWPMFSVRKGTVMESTKLPYRVWAVGIYLFTTNIKGVSSMRLHRELGIGQKAAWFMLHRLRKAVELGGGVFQGPVEVDETYVGGRRRNMSKAKRKELTGRGVVGKTAVAGLKDRASKRVSARVVTDTKSETMSRFIMEHVKPGTKIYTDDALTYHTLPNHETVRHSVGEYVRGMAHTNGVESFWSMLKRAHTGIYHKMSPKHLDRYVSEFSGRYNVREADTIDQMGRIAEGMVAKRLRYRNLIADNGLASGARCRPSLKWMVQ